MGWLPVFRKRKGDEHPESGAVPDSGGVMAPRGTGGGGGGHVNVVTAVGGGGGGSSTITHHNGVVGWVCGGYVLGAKYPGVDRDPGYCGHLGSIVLVGGCEEGHVFAWLACRKCQMEVLFEVKANPPTQCFMPCGHLYSDLIYSYLPSNPEYAKLGSRMFEVTGAEA